MNPQFKEAVRNKTMQQMFPDFSLIVIILLY